MKRRSRGFTIAELVIVVAVIGVLSAVLIPTFANLAGKAGTASDSALVENLNKQLAMSEGLEGKNASMREVMEDVGEVGYTSASIKSSSDNAIVWDEAIDRFALIDGNGQRISGESESSGIKLWQISDAVRPDDAYSTYYVGEADAVTFGKGIECEDMVRAMTLIYDNQSSVKQDVPIRVNNAHSTVVIQNAYIDSEDPNRGDHITVYGKAKQIVGPENGGEYAGFSVAFGSLEVKGKVLGLKVESGCVELGEAISDQNHRMLLYATSANVEVSNPNGVALRARTASSGIAESLNGNAEGVEWVYDEQTDFDSVIATSVTVEENEEAASAHPDYAVRIVGQSGEETFFPSLSEAVSAAGQGDTIALLRDDVEGESALAITKAVKIDLFGHTISRDTANQAITISTGGNLVIENTSDVGSVEGKTYGIYLSAAGAKLTVNSGKVSGQYGIYAYAKSTVDINGGEVAGTTAAIYNRTTGTINVHDGSIHATTTGIYNKAGGTINVYGGNIKGGISKNQFGINNYGAGKANVSGGTITGYYGVYNYAKGTVSVSGGTVASGSTASASYGIYNNAAGQIGLTGGMVRGYNGILNKGNLTIAEGTVQATTQYGVNSSGTVTLNGGKIIGTGSKGVGIYSTATGDKLNIGGGSVSGKVYAIQLNAATASCVITDGSFESAGIVCYAAKGFFAISGGSFKTTSTKTATISKTLDCLDTSFSAEEPLAGFTVSGGSFYKFDPSKCSEVTTVGTVTYNATSKYYTVVEE